MVLIQMHRGGGGLFSRAIRWFSRSDYSHVSLWFYDPAHEHGGLVIEALEGEGVRVVPADWYRAARDEGRIRLYALRLPLSREQYATMWARLVQERGAKYDWLGVFRFVTKRRKDGHPDKWFCSELAAFGFAHVGRPLLHTPAWQVTPGDIPRSPEVVPCDNPEAV